MCTNKRLMLNCAILETVTVRKKEHRLVKKFIYKMYSQIIYLIYMYKIPYKS